MPELVSAYFDWLASMYDEATAACVWAAPAQLAKHGVPLVKPGDCVLDLGVGTGQSAAPFLAHGCRVVGLDFARAMLAEAATNYSQASLVRADLDGAHWPLRAGCCQLAVSSGVFECLADQPGFLQRVHRAIAPGGHLVLTFDEYVAGHPVQGLAHGRADSGLDSPIAHLAGWQIHRQTVRQVDAWLAEFGFERLHEEQFEADIHSHFRVPIYYRAMVARRVGD